VYSGTNLLKPILNQSRRLSVKVYIISILCWITMTILWIGRFLQCIQMTVHLNICVSVFFLP